MTVFQDYLRALLIERGMLPFVDYMEHALYAPHVGYYHRGANIGKGGDFITAPELTPLFGYTMAQQCKEIITELSMPIILEFGAGTGQLCIDLLTGLERLHCLPFEYHILDVSSGLRDQQHAHIAEKIPHLLDKVKWLTAWPESFSGIIIANEVLDAMPVHRFMQTDKGLLESYIALDEQDTFVEILQPCRNQALIDHVKRVLPIDNIYSSAQSIPYQSEANLLIDPWLKECSRVLAQGVMFVIDYGFPRHEYYHAERSMGTLMCHYQHQAHTNPLAHPGEEDITAHVDFTHVAEAAHNAGFDVMGFTNQASFLISNGLLNCLAAIYDEPHYHRATMAVKQLIQPNEMGELFKVMALSKQWNTPLTGFQLQDKRASL